MRHLFKATGRLDIKPGDLIRSNNSGNFINVVLSVSEVFEEKLCPISGKPLYFVHVRSVRYGNTNGGNFKLLPGRRSRTFYFCVNDLERCNWEIVKEYAEVNNKQCIEDILKELADTDTAYKRS